jgi:enamine deaminase RidA (YjgF/YER057c/UK114 family)
MSRPGSAVRLVRSAALTDAAPYAYAATTEPGAQLVAALGAAGATLQDVAYTRVLVATTVREDLLQAWTVVHDAFGEHEVPSTLHGVTVLAYPDQLVEIEAVAALR